MNLITIETTINAPVAKVWSLWTEPKHIVNWNNATDDWHTPKAENDLRPGGKFVSTMAARDGSVSFDFTGEYTAIGTHKLIEYNIMDGRHVKVEFAADGDNCRIIESFEPEKVHSSEQQREGWQAILNNCKRYAEQI